ncbi:hypothetical protein DFH28DRAFT_936195 [Melampsora americana]|nr:hypothetical protein DFH28DRAFT_936195 [Melampsora americana]
MSTLSAFQSGPCPECSGIFKYWTTESCGECTNAQMRDTGVDVTLKMYCGDCGKGYPRMKGKVCNPCKKQSTPSTPVTPHCDNILRQKLNNSMLQIANSPHCLTTPNAMDVIHSVASKASESASQSRKVGTHIQNSLTISQSKSKKNIKKGPLASIHPPSATSSQNPFSAGLGSRSVTAIPATTSVQPSNFNKFISIKFVYHMHSEIEHNIAADTLGIDYNNPSWFSQLASNAFTHFAKKAFKRFPTSDQMEEGIPVIPSYNEQWVSLGQYMTKGEPTIFSEASHLQESINKPKRRGYNAAGLFVLFDANEYLCLMGDKGDKASGSQKRSHNSVSEDTLEFSDGGQEVKTPVPKSKRPRSNTCDRIPDIESIFSAEYPDPTVTPTQSNHELKQIAIHDKETSNSRKAPPKRSVNLYLDSVIGVRATDPVMEPISLRNDLAALDTITQPVWEKPGKPWRLGFVKFLLAYLDVNEEPSMGWLDFSNSKEDPSTKDLLPWPAQVNMKRICGESNFYTITLTPYLSPSSGAYADYDPSDPIYRLLMHTLAHSSLEDLDGKAMINVLKVAGNIITDVQMIHSGFLMEEGIENNPAEALIAQFKEIRCPPLCELLGLHKHDKTASEAVVKAGSLIAFVRVGCDQLCNGGRSAPLDCLTASVVVVTIRSWNSEMKSVY